MTAQPAGRPSDDAAAYWDDVWSSRAPSETSWYQSTPGRAARFVIELVERSRPTMSALDVGGGASSLVRNLLDAGAVDLTVLDISDAALSHVRQDLGTRANQVEFVVADIRSWVPLRTWDIWHDHAVLHFMTSDVDASAYARACASAIAPGGVAVISAFALDGPEMCSGLPVRRHDAATIAECLAPWFELDESWPETHVTPHGVDQNFIVATLNRTDRRE